MDRKLKNIASRPGVMKSNGDYEWNFSTFGGVTRVNIATGEDIAHLRELDQKLWTVLSCPASGLEMDPETLGLLDLDGDGNIHVNEILKTVDWLGCVLTDFGPLVDKSPGLELSAIRTDTPEGSLLHSCAVQLLKNKAEICPGTSMDKVSLQDVSDREAIFAGTKFNGDGVIIPESADDEEIRKLISECMSTIGSVRDRSGKDGIDSAKLDAFYASATALDAWKKADRRELYAYGDDTAAALDVCNELKAKVEDFYMRCALASFNPDSTAVLDVTAARIGDISGKDLSASAEDIAAYPIARVNTEGKLHFGSINPAWKGVFDKFKALVLDREFPGAKFLTQAQWRQCTAKLDGYAAHIAAKTGTEVESLGYGRVAEIVSRGRKAEIEALIAQDLSLGKEVEATRELRKLLVLHRDFHKFLRNYVTFSDFYCTDDGAAIFQAGRLYIDQRSCDLCIRVSDMGKQNAMAGNSGMYLIYCDCVARHSNARMTIVAVMTDGEVNNLKVGVNAIFYDRQGNDYDATVVKIIDNPISVRQAFWAPYRKMGSFIGDQINKVAAKQDSKVMSEASARISAAGEKAAAPPAEAQKQAAPFDVTKFAGIFAMIGMALGSIGTFLASALATLTSLGWLQLLATILGIILIISGPSMVMAWLKLRKRNLAPILNANGWAVNSSVIVNVRFGQKLTSVAKLPVFAGNDPFADKKMPLWKKALLWIGVGVVLAVGIYYLLPEDLRPSWREKECAVESVETGGTVLEEVPAEAE
ncbi:MAG: hypothetical protein ACI39U_01215 [Candidatus Cryptobacteroides sp.]